MSQKSEEKSRSLEKYNPQSGLPERVQRDQTDGVGTEVVAGKLARPQKSRRFRDWQKWLIRLGVLLVIATIIGILVWRNQRATEVALVNPRLTAITETIASSGRVGGQTETMVGAQVTGIVEQLNVKEGDRVAKGQLLAVLKNDVAEAQVAQAEESVSTALAQLAQTSRGPLPSEVESASEQVNQAQAQVTQQQTSITQARQSVNQAIAQLNQLKAERDLAAKELTRMRSLLESGVVPRAEYDQAEANLKVAEEKVSAQQQAVELAREGVRQSEASLSAAQANLRAQRAQLQTVKSSPRPEDVEVARRRVREAEEALRVARRQAANARVVAPFAGTVTEINAEPGQPVGTAGVVQLVSDEPEIRLDVDETNLADLHLGQTAIVSSNTFSDSTFEARVTEIGPAVDVARGTIQVTVVPQNPPDWLRPGQTVNVNIVTAKDAERLLIPQTALARAGDQTVVYVVENGVALQKPVVTRPPTDEGVPVLAGLKPDDLIIADAAKIEAGEEVRITARSEGQP